MDLDDLFADLPPTRRNEGTVVVVPATVVASKSGLGSATMPNLAPSSPSTGSSPSEPVVASSVADVGDSVRDENNGDLLGLDETALLQLIQEEEDAHEEWMRRKKQEIRNLVALVEEEERLLARELPELLQLQDQQQQEVPSKPPSSVPNGSTNVDCYIRQLEECLKMVSGSTKNLLVKLEAATQSCTAPAGTSDNTGRVRLTAAPLPGSGSTNVIFLFHPTVRGVRRWAKSHTTTCSRCAMAQATINRAEIAFRPSAGALGLAAMPNFAAMPGKQAYSLMARILPQPSLGHRGEDEMFFSVFRIAFDLKVRHTSGMDRNTWCTKLENLCNSWMNRLLTKITKASGDSASSGGDVGSAARPRISPAVELFSHSLSVQAEVQVMASGTASNVTGGGAAPNQRHRDPMQWGQQQPTRAGDEEVCLRLQMSFSTPLYVAALSQFLVVIRERTQRTELLFNVIQPVVMEMAHKFNKADVVFPHLQTALSATEAAWNLTDVHCDCTNAAGRYAFLKRWYCILTGLGAFATTIQVDWAVPRQQQQQQPFPSGHSSTTTSTSEGPPPSSPKANTASQTIREYGLFLAKGLLRFIAPPAAPAFPPRMDPEAVELSVVLRGIPRALAEVLGTEFAPAASPTQSSMLDFFLSAKTKMNIGLRMFSDFCVDIYRPFHARTGVKIAPASPQTRPCEPVVEFTPQMTSANLMLAEAHDMLLKVLENAVRRSLAYDEVVESSYTSARAALSEAVLSSDIAKDMQNDFASLGLTEKQWTSLKFDVLLPLHQFEMIAPESVRFEPLLYASLKISKTN